MENDEYVMRLSAEDVNGRSVSYEMPFSIGGNRKLGNFTLSFTDLQTSAVGMPIVVKRIYDTLNATSSGDFGFGWRMESRDGRIRETVPVISGEQNNAFLSRPFRLGARVYITNPEGRRIAFTFAPTFTGGLLGTIWHPRFVADPGVDETLTVEDIPLAQSGSGTFSLYLVGFPWNPREYTLTTKNGTRYVHDQFDGLRRMIDLNGNTLTFSATGIVASSGRRIEFRRDAFGRMSELVDSAGNVVRYGYDGSGDLVSVTDALGADALRVPRSAATLSLERDRSTRQRRCERDL